MAESTNDNGKHPLADLTREKLSEGVMVAGIFLLPTTVLILAAQFIFYLKDGVRPKWVLFSLVNSALPEPFLQWLVSPQDWRGLHKIVAWILLEAPIWVDTLALAFICILAVDKIAGKKNAPHPSK